MPLVEIKNFNSLIDNKAFFDQPIQNKQEAYEKLIQMSRNDDYTTGNLLFTVKFINLTLFRFIKTNKYKYWSTNKFYRKIRRRW